MRKVLFLMTHQGYDSQVFDWLTTHPYIDGIDSGQKYIDYETLSRLTSLPHKEAGPLAIYLDVLKCNHQLTCRPLLQACDFVYFLDHPQRVMRNLLKTFEPRNAFLYYSFRMRGLYHFWKKRPTIWFSWDNQEQIAQVQAYLKWKEPLSLPACEEMVSEEAQECYERYLKLFKIDKCSFA